MDQIMYASFSNTHYLYEVGMLTVSEVVAPVEIGPILTV